MRKYIILSMLIFPLNVFAWTFNTRVAECGTYAVNCSSFAATVIRPAVATRNGISIYNNSAYDLYIATYAATSTTNLYVLKSSGTLERDGEYGYIGAFYGLGTAGQAALNIRVIEKK